MTSFTLTAEAAFAANTQSFSIKAPTGSLANRNKGFTSSSVTAGHGYLHVTDSWTGLTAAETGEEDSDITDDSDSHIA